MTAQVQHGDYRCYLRTRCARPECRAAWSDYQKRWKHRTHAQREQGPLLVDAIGTRRRVQALAYMGYSGQWMADQLGLTRRGIWLLMERDKVTKRTAEKIRELYDKWAMEPSTNPRSNRVRSWARSKGYVGPLAWDENEIDDPKAMPRGLAPEIRAKWCLKGLHLKAEAGEYLRPGRPGECRQCRQARQREYYQAKRQRAQALAA